MGKSNVVPAAQEQPTAVPETTRSHGSTNTEQAPDNSSTREVEVLQPSFPFRRFLPERKRGKDGRGH